jgi:hypothetical protein
MSGKSRWEKKKVGCDGSDRENELLIEWRKTEGGKEEIGSVSCDDPKLTDYDGGDCDWTCIDGIEGGEGSREKGEDAKP